MSDNEVPRIGTAEQRMDELGIQLPVSPQPFGAHVMAVQACDLLVLTGMLPTVGA